jgi:cytochrome d ubiquinol oxidase subunit II
MHKWFSWSQIVWLPPVPFATGVLFLLTHWSINKLEQKSIQQEWLPFTCVIAIFWLAFLGLLTAFSSHHH